MGFKKLLCLLISVVLIFSVCACAKTESADTETAEETTVSETVASEDSDEQDDYVTISIDGLEEFSIPDIGGEIDGFTVTGIYDLIETEGKYITFEHEATGLQLVYAACADKNRAFDIGFATRGENNYGTPHVLEHCTICSSDKYPASAIFFDANNSCYVTYMNASTYPYLTSYYSSSLSELQLTTLFDMYFNSVFHPSVVSDDHFLNREGWRYELESPESDLTINGVIYNEMQGALGSISSYSYYKTKAAMYEGTAASYNTGGNPEDLINLTHEELVDYYNKYYTPSNALIIFYGDIDIFYYLDKLNNEYLVGMEKTEAPEIGCNYSNPDFGGVKRVTIEMPAAADASDESSSYIRYAIDLGDITAEDSFIIHSILKPVLTSESSPITKLVDELLPGRNYSIYYETLGSPMYFNLSDSDEEDAEIFMDAVNKGLQQILDEGFDEIALEAIKKSFKRSIIFNQGESLGTDFFSGSYDYFWACTGDSSAFLHCTEAALDFADNGTVDDIQKLIKAHLINPSQAVLSVTVPVPGLIEKNEQELKEELAAKKASMSEEEIDALVASTQEFYDIEAAYEESESPVNDIAILTPDDLEVEYDLIDVADEEKDGVRYLTADISSDDYVAIDYYFDSSIIAQEDLLDYRFLAYILGYVDTDNYTYEEIASLMTMYCKSYYTNAYNIIKDSGTAVPKFEIYYSTLTEDAVKAEELWNEILYNSDFSNYDRIRNLAAEAVGEDKAYYNSSPRNLAIYIARSQSNPSMLYDCYMNFFDYWKYLEKISKMDDDEMAVFTAKLDVILDKLMNKNNLACGIYASKANQAAMTELADAFVAKLSDEKEETYTYSFDRLPKHIAIKADGTNNYNLIYGSEDTAGELPDASIYAATSIVSSDYLYPEMRVNRGCYGASTNSYDNLGFVCYTYRDPDIKETYEYYDELPELLREAEYTQDDIDTAIVQSYSDLSSPCGELTVASVTIEGLICGGDTADVVLKQMEELKAATPECVKEYANIFEKAYDNGYRITIGCSTDIDKDADIFDLIIDDLIK